MGIYLFIFYFFIFLIFLLYFFSIFLFFFYFSCFLAFPIFLVSLFFSFFIYLLNYFSFLFFSGNFLLSRCILSTAADDGNHATMGILFYLLLLTELSTLKLLLIAKLFIGTALRPPPHPLLHLAGVSLTTMNIVFTDKIILLRIFPNLFFIIPYIIIHILWQSYTYRYHYHLLYHRPTIINDNIIHDNNRWIRTDMKKRNLIRRHHNNSRRNKNINLVKYKEPPTRYQLPQKSIWLYLD